MLETAVYLNAALTAYDVRKEVESIDHKSVRVVYGVFDLADQKVHALPRHIHDEESSTFGQVPATAEEFTTLADQIARGVLARGGESPPSAAQARGTRKRRT